MPGPLGSRWPQGAPGALRRRVRGLTILEVLISAVLMVLLIVPLTRMLISTNRAGESAERTVTATLHGEAILEALAALPLEEFPPVFPGAPTTLWDEAEGSTDILDPGGRLASVLEVLDQASELERLSPTKFVDLARNVQLEYVAPDVALLRVAVGYDRFPLRNPAGGPSPTRAQLEFTSVVRQAPLPSDG